MTTRSAYSSSSAAAVSLALGMEEFCLAVSPAPAACPTAHAGGAGSGCTSVDMTRCARDPAAGDLPGRDLPDRDNRHDAWLPYRPQQPGRGRPYRHDAAGL